MDLVKSVFKKIYIYLKKNRTRKRVGEPSNRRRTTENVTQKKNSINGLLKKQTNKKRQ